MKYIPLTQGKQAIVDDCDYEWLSKFKWRYSSGYACRWITVSRKKQKLIFMHCLILGQKEGYVSDHINMDGLDNRRENLRFATKSQNGANRPMQVNNTSGYKGVRKLGATTWQAQIGSPSNHEYLGSFNTKEEAARAYNNRAVELYGEYAALNMIQGEDTTAGCIRSMEEGK